MVIEEIIYSEEIDIRLDSVILKAHSLTEILESRSVAFTDTTNISSTTIQALEKEWAAIVGMNSVEQFYDWLALMNWEKEDFFRAVKSEVLLSNTHFLPDWAIMLKSLFEKLPQYCEQQTETVTIEGGQNINHLLQPFISIARDHIISEANRLGVEITFESGKGMAMTLSQRLSTLCVSVLDAEIYLNSIMGIFGNSANKLGSFEAWIERIERYPVLGRLIAVAYLHWANGITEFMERLSSDFDFITSTFFNNQNLGYLINYSGDAGDVHCKGRSVALLTFSGGRKLVYKPKNLEIGNTYFALINELNNELTVKLSTRIITVRGDYSWEEFITHKECENKAEFPDFFKRLGMITRLFQLTGARDFWLDNLIAHGNQPTFVDLEMVIQHLKKEGTDLLISEQMGLDEIEESVSKIGIVSFITPIGFGVKAEDLATLSPIRKLTSPFKLSLSAKKSIGVSINKTDDGYIQWEKKDYLPSFKGEYAKSSDYMSFFLDGYTEMNTVLCKLKNDLLYTRDILNKFSKATLRYIHRDTWTYMRIIKISTQGQYLGNGIERDKALFMLYNEVWHQHKIDGSKAVILTDEIKSMTELDIPFFDAFGKSRDLVFSGHKLEKYFSHSGLDMLLSRLEAIESFDLEKNIQIILSNFYCSDHPSPKVKYHLIESKNVPNIEWGMWAKKCAELIAKQAITGPEGDIAWIGLDYQPHIGSNMFAVLKPDILSGTCGLSMLFTDLYKAYGTELYKNIAINSLASTKSIVNNSIKNFSNLDFVWSQSKNPIFIGAYFGIGSQILALEYAASQFNSTEIREVLNQYVSAIPLAKIRAYATTDFISGYSGLLFSLHGIINDSDLKNLTDFEFTDRKIFPEHLKELEQLPSNQFGFDYFKQILKIASSDFVIKDPNSIGELFTSLQFITNQTSSANIDIIDLYLAKDSEHLLTSDLLDRAELALNLFEIINEQKYLLKAQTLASEIIFRKEKTGKWFADIWASDIHNISVVRGIGALCHLFLRLDKVSTFGSFRRLNTFKNIILHEK